MPTRHTAPITANFGGALKRLRSARGVTQEDMFTSTSRRHVGRIEQGHQTPSIRAIEGLARTLEIHPLTLVAAAYCQELDGQLIAELMRTVEEDFAKLMSASGSKGAVPAPHESSESVP
jgi:transcriptional regulator with XRE-family HTH domain